MYLLKFKNLQYFFVRRLFVSDKVCVQTTYTDDHTVLSLLSCQCVYLVDHRCNTVPQGCMLHNSFRMACSPPRFDVAAVYDMNRGTDCNHCIIMEQMKVRE